MNRARVGQPQRKIFQLSYDPPSFPFPIMRLGHKLPVLSASLFPPLATDPLRLVPERNIPDQRANIHNLSGPDQLDHHRGWRRLITTRLNSSDPSAIPIRANHPTLGILIGKDP